MKVLTPGHAYALDFFEDRDRPGQTLQFIQKEGEPLKTVNDGTTNEEVLSMLIDRLRFLHGKLPSRETAIAITKLEEALMWLEKRTAERKARRVEGTHKA
jgi:hypothetical protein